MQNQPQRKIVTIIRWTVVAMLATSATLLMLMITHRQLRYDDITSIRDDDGVVHTRSELSDLLKRRLNSWYPQWFETPYAVWLPAGYDDEDLSLLKRFKDLSTISLEGTSISDEGVPMGLYGSIVDISETRRVEQTIRIRYCQFDILRAE